MSSITALILGLVQGLTEFLPISSSGHLVLAEEILDYSAPGLLLETVVHVATTLAVIIFFRRRFVEIIKRLPEDPATRRLVLMLGLAFIVTAGLGLAMGDRIVSAFESPALVGGMLLTTGVVLLSTRYIKPISGATSLFGITWKVALLIGLAQGLAIFPGISRSGLTIVAGLWVGTERTAAAEFSFLLSVPTILAASLFSLWLEPDLSGADAGSLLIAGAAAFISGLVAIQWLMLWLQKGQLWWFSMYCGIIGVIAVVVWGVGGA